MNNEIKDDLPENWPVWTRKMVNDLQAAEDMAGKCFLDKAPDWAKRIWSKLIKLIFATVNVADYQESGARFAGAVLGHHQSLLKGKNGLEKQSKRMTQALEWLDDKLKRKLNKKAYRKMIADRQATKGKIPNVVTKATGEACLDYGAVTCLKHGRDFIASLGGNILKEKLSRVDIALDIPRIGMRDFFAAFKEERYICRAKSLAYMKSNGLTLKFGENPLLLRIYDKLAETQKRANPWKTLAME